MITELSSGIVMIVFNFIILGLQGNVGVAAYGVIANIALVILSIFTGIAQGSQPIISGYFGRGQHTDAKKVYRYGLITAVLFSVLIYLLSVLYEKPIVGIFNKDKDPFLQAIAVQGIRLYFIGFLFAGINVITSAFLSAADRPKPAFLISSSRGFVLIIPVAWLMSALLSMNGVWLSFPVTELLTCFLSFWAVKIKSSQP
ncbi:MAG: MATE family efflux transporter [Lachnospiraceae bacterium]